MPAVQRQGDALILHLHVQPGASRDAVVGLHGERLRVRITAPPVDGKANRHLIEWLAALFDVPRSRVTLLRGETGRVKTIRIDSPRTVPPEIAQLTVDPA
ncbi:DUF167 family protein [Povalibacter sp.]|uniref:DUF167 family protein n=1 Tax=Povalibacter sp. TaxID=1962978 RepID=UPI002F41C03B